MAQSSIKPQNLPEYLVWYYIISTYLIYYIGAQFIFAPLLAIALNVILIAQWLNMKEVNISLPAWVWLVAMLFIEAVLIIGHLNFNLDLSEIIKSSINRWFRMFFLYAMFILAGHLSIRLKLVCRAICYLSVQSIFLIPLFFLGNILGLQELAFTSPLHVFGGGDFYDVNVFLGQIDGEQLRLTLFTPWAPALGLVGNIFFWLAFQEENRNLRRLGILGSLLAILLSQSRLALLCLPFVWIMRLLIPNMLSPKIHFALSFSNFIGGMFFTRIAFIFDSLKDQFVSYRPGSSRVRSTLERMAIYRWRNEAPIWGHGTIVSPGPAVVDGKPIGTHHAWYSLLYSHGIVGLLAFAIPVAWSFIYLLPYIKKVKIAKVGQVILLTLFAFSFGENLDVLAYIIWPALIVLGIVFRECHLYSLRNETERLLAL
jgi:hypothetical protein